MNAIDPSADNSASARDELVFESERTRVWRRRRDGTQHVIILKEPLGHDAATRLHRERRILERLRDVEGVPHLAAGVAPHGMLLLENSIGKRMADLPTCELMNPRDQVQFMLQLVRIVAAIHALGVVHKDINPVHILLCGAERRPLLLHFELATTSAEEHSAFVHHRNIAGTLAYLAPELTGRTGRSVDQRADLYALGATFYEVSTGLVPFKEADPLQLIHDVLVRVPVAPIALRPTMPVALSAIIMRLLEKEPDRRYQSADGLAYDLAQVCRQLEHGTTQPFVLGERDFAPRLLAPSRLVGRDAEVHALQAAFRSSVQDGGRSVLICGPPGVGKTALMNELRSTVTAQNGWFVSGKFDPRRRDASSDGVLQALQALGRLLLAEPESELAPLRADMLHTLGTNAEVVAALLPQFELLLGIAPGLDTQDPLKHSGQIIQATLDLLRAIVSPTRPVVLVLDDLQWAGSTALGFFDAALRSEGLPGLLLVGVCREADEDAAPSFDATLSRWQKLNAGPVFLRLQSLAPAELSVLLGEILRLPPDQAQKLAHDMGERTGGNPHETVDLVNALRRDGILVAQDGEWNWDAETIRRYIGSNDVAHLLVARLERLPEQTQSLLECMACLGIEVEVSVLQVASGLSAVQCDEHLAPALEDGLVTFEQGGQNTVRFRTDRVRQLVHDAREGVSRNRLQIVFARRLAEQPALESLAAEQYVPALQELPAEERPSVAALLRRSADAARLTDPVTTERLLAAALSMLNAAPEPADDGLLLSLEIDRHAALNSLGRLEEADEVYRSIELRCRDPQQIIAAACIQVSSISSRGKHRDALALGFGLLMQLGFQPPGTDIDAELELRLQATYDWLSHLDTAAELRRAPATDPRLLAATKLLNRLTAAAFFSDPKVSFWLALEGRRLCVERGHTVGLVGTSTFAPVALVALRGDYRAAYALSRHVRELATVFGNEHDVLHTRFHTAFVEHWFEPLSEDIEKYERIRTGFLREGDVRLACYLYHVSIPAVLECAPTLDACMTEVDAALALAGRSSDEHSRAPFIGFRQLLRSLRGETDSAGSFNEEDFDEARYLADIGKSPMAMAFYHINRALMTLLFDGPSRDLEHLSHHAFKGLRLVPFIECHYHVALAHFLHAIALASQIRTSPPQSSDKLLERFSSSRDWLAHRAADSPENFLNLLHLVDAEKAWALGEPDAALVAFDLALREAQRHKRPWQSALIAERAGRFHLVRGLEHTGRALLSEARGHYEKWGAAGKVRDLQSTHGFLRSSAVNRYARLRSVQTDSGSLSSDSIDMLAILRASQALSSETSLPRLKARVVELLGALSGATRVLLIFKGEDASGWSISLSAEDGGETLPVTEAGARSLVPLSIFRYAERTREPLLLDDATRDDRFSRDPYFAGLECCSLLVAPILSQGVPRAVLVLENRSSRGAFSADRLDAVMLIAGQLGVSLDNASRYEMLERKVSERTAELAHSLSLIRATLESSTDAVVAVDNTGKVTTFNEHYLRMWDLPRELLEGQHSRNAFKVITGKLKDAGLTVARVRRLVAHPEEESSAIIELHDGRVFEEHSRPQKIGQERIGRIFCFHEITERRRAEAELQAVHQRLVDASRQGGMAEVATNVLHNVGNVLTSVNVSATVVAESLRKSRFAGLHKLVTLLREPQRDLAEFMASERGKQVPTYLAQLATQLQADQETSVRELELLRSHIEHIRDIVTMQQTYARTSSIKETVILSELVEDSLRLNLGALSRHGVQIERAFESLPPLKIEKHKVLQVLVNLISNAKYACDSAQCNDKRVTLRIARDPETGGAHVSVTDNGVGIPEENLTRIFNHGFTTRVEGHGFGLHSSALAAREIGGALTVHSDGVGTGATFTLQLPLEAASQS